jgi:hypothetical protein
MFQSGKIAEHAQRYIGDPDPVDLSADLALARGVRDMLAQRFESDVELQDGSADARQTLMAFDTIAKLARAQHGKVHANAIPAQKVAQLLQEMQRVVEGYVHDESVREQILAAWRQIVVG